MTTLPMLAKLPGTRGTKGKPRGLEYRPWSRLAIVDEPRRTLKYAVAELPTDVPGRAFRVTKQTAGSVPRCCLVAADGNHLCDCEGFESDARRRADERAGSRYSEAQPCIHLDIAVALVENRWLDREQVHRADDADEDTGATEVFEIDPLPECFRVPTEWAGVPF